MKHSHKPPLSIWLLTDGLPGHANQSKGIIRALNRRYQPQVYEINVSLKHKALRALTRLLANKVPASLPHLWQWFYQIEDRGAPKPDLIISAGGNTLGANISLAAYHQCRNIFSGTIKGYGAEKLDLIITVSPIKNASNNLVLDLPPSVIEPGDAAVSTSGLCSLLIGASGAGYDYSEQDWLNLASGINNLSEREGIRWLITTSRRTDPAVEDLLEKHLDPKHIAEAVWFSRNPAKVMKRFLESADAVFVTEDSLTMVAEAIFSRRGVCTLQPKQMHPVDNDEQALKKYQTLGYIRRVPLESLISVELSGLRAAELPDIDETIAAAVEKLLND
ncbi:MAG: mitochondrial fission ELM1 family protein [Hahellaceae bacterium]|nr:mitochondrial fission ELM1 family protein [Hahellaceae bacterium]MCP5168646.1 mitochondrial fission ELM1 family protein [Hahellaceae bacterium]